MLENLRYFFYGTLIFQVIFMVIFYVQHQKKTYYIYYSLYVLGIFLIMEPKLLFGLRNALVFLIERPTVLAYFLFLDAFLELSDQSLRFRRFMKYLKIGIWSLLLFHLVLTFAHLYFFRVQALEQAISFFDHLFFFLVYLAALYSFYETYQLKNIYSRYILVGASFLLCGIIINRQYYEVVSDVPVILGALLELFCFSAAIGYKTNLTESEKRQAQQQQAEADRLRELDKFKSRFYTNITHEFRTPLTVIQGLAHQINQQHPNRVIRKHVKLIKKNSDQLLGLVNQMLDLSKLEAKKVELEYIQADIISFLQQQVQTFETLAAEKEIQLTFEADQESFVMDFDPARIRDIINNLVANALKFTPVKGRVKLTAGMLRKGQQAYLEIVVADSGIGIARDKLLYLFDRFYQVDDSLTRQAEGTGVGLALTKELVHLMGGCIDVNSTLGAGSRFTVQLPVTNRASRQSFENFQQRSTATGLLNGHPLPVAHQDNHRAQVAPRVLIVEDNADVIYYLRTCLKNQYRVITAANGEEGMQQAMEHAPDLIISDVMMPKMDGYTLCHQLKHHEATNHIPIILLTAKTADADRKEGLGRGADAYLEKPFDPEELLIRIEQLLQQRATLKKKYWQAARIRRLEDLDLAPESQTFVERLDECIFQNFADPKFKVDQLATAMFMSRTSLLKEMKKHIGKSPSQYINRARLDLADQLLRETKLTIAAIAQQSGFSSDSYFTKKYEAAFGEKPSERRRFIREKEDSG